MGEPCPTKLKEFPFTQEEIFALWKYATKNYIDKGGRSIEETAQGVARDLGLRPEWVMRALTRNKTIRKTTMEMYARQSDRRLAVQHAKDIVRGQDLPEYKHVLAALNAIPRAISVFGHGTVGMLTHAGANIFRPTAWKVFWPNFIRQFRMVGSSGYHEMQIQDLMSNPNFYLAKKAGLANDPARTYTDYTKYAKYFGPKWGRRGFDALKTTRQAYFDEFWNKVPESIKSDQAAALDMASNRSEAINHSTGVITMKQDSFLSKGSAFLDPVLFAARLEASRWARILGDPIKTADTFANWKNATPGERSVARMRLGHATEFAAFYVGTLIANQALLSAIGSKDKINFFHPEDSGTWMKHIIGGHTVAVDGGLLAPVRLIGQLIAKDMLGTKAMRRGDNRTSAAVKDIGYYALGRINPSLQLGKEVLTGESFQGREIPVSLPAAARWARGEPPPAFRPGKEPLTIGEFALEHGPIPLSGASREIYDNLRLHGMNAIDATTFMRAAAIFAAENTGAKVAPIRTPPPAKSGSLKPAY